MGKFPTTLREQFKKDWGKEMPDTSPPDLDALNTRIIEMHKSLSGNKHGAFVPWQASIGLLFNDIRKAIASLQAENKDLAWTLGKLNGAIGRVEEDKNKSVVALRARITELEAAQLIYLDRLMEECRCLSFDGDGTCPLPTCLARPVTESSE